jgi:branched-chain amino acid transport system permease protein
MEEFIHQVVSGLSSGSIYATVALALVMIFKSTGRINFAQGEMAMFTTYLAWAMVAAGVPYWIAFFCTLVLAFLLGAVIEIVAVRPVQHAPPLTMVVISVGVLLLLNSVAGWIFTYTIKTFPSPFPTSAPFGFTFVSWHELGSLGVTLLLMGGLFAFFRFTSLGLAMRAAAQNPESARLAGIRVGWMRTLGWGLAAAIGATAGMLIAPKVFLDPYMMSGVLIYAFAAALVGGIDSPGGAIVGGLVVGLLETLVGAYVIGDELKLMFAVFVIVVVLLLRPVGLFGQVIVKRV